ncbi:MAG: helix-turn-helix domain-containing protein [Pseudomonadota bacterium]
MSSVGDISLIWGVSNIAKAIRRTPRQTQYALSNGELPARKVGTRWVIHRDALDEWFRKTTKAAAER